MCCVFCSRRTSTPTPTPPPNTMCTRSSVRENVKTLQTLTCTLRENCVVHNLAECLEPIRLFPKRRRERQKPFGRDRNSPEHVITLSNSIVSAFTDINFAFSTFLLILNHSGPLLLPHCYSMISNLFSYRHS